LIALPSKSVRGGTTILLKSTRHVPSNPVNVSKIGVGHKAPLRVACHRNIMSFKNQGANIENEEAKCLNNMSCKFKMARKRQVC